jgi:Ser/Thr protein kinase RdoA (MazF antagonist)
MAYLIKELPVESGAAVLDAARFERDAFEAGIVPMAEPCPDRDGELLRPMTGSRGRAVLVRVHRYLAGREPDRPVGRETVREAGRSLARIHDFGEGWAAAGGALPAKPLWTRPDRELFDAFVDRWPDLVPSPDPARQSLERAEQLVRKSVAGSFAAQPSHCDHKPDNSLLDGDRLIILDWDEAGSCDPRIEALETALRWSWTGSDGPDPNRVASFAQAYRVIGRPFPAVLEADWAKWVAGIASWYEFNAQRARGDWPTVAASEEQDARSAAEALHGLRDTMDRIPTWTNAINAALDRAPAAARPSDG